MLDIYRGDISNGARFNMCTVIRNIYPIGQGGFASEYHVDNDKTIIYDCGSISHNIRPVFYELIKNCLSSDTIDILFISHFDDDHINQISILKKYKKIKNVVIPLVKNIKLLEFLSEETETKRFIRNPEEFFGNETKVIRITEFESESDENDNPINIDEKQPNEISSFQPITFNNYSWEYIPFNVKEDERMALFNKKCKNEGIDCSQLDNLDYLYQNENLIRKIYKSIKGGINANSMLLYSGTNSSTIKSFIYDSNCTCNFRYYYDWRCFCVPHCKYRLYQNNNKEACLYTGDWDCSWINELRTKFLKRIDRIGLIQIPHHGSRYNFKEELILNEHLHWFVQYGVNNKYRHPSESVYDSILQKSNLQYIHSVTEFNHLQQVIYHL